MNLCMTLNRFCGMDKNILRKTTVSYNISKDLHPLKYQYIVVIIIII